MKRMMLALGVAALGMSSLAMADGAAVFTRCAACHLPNGAGVPGAYPPLGPDFRALAATPAGRKYLSMVMIKGLAGPITVGGKQYRGVMPMQNLNDADAAAVLNHVGTKIAKVGPPFKAFTPADIAAARKAGAALTPADVAKMHATAGGK